MGERVHEYIDVYLKHRQQFIQDKTTNSSSVRMYNSDSCYRLWSVLSDM